ncbi:uncharacterized protein Z518_08628 [Rhinocladiella mackenziei CBS 650.93]|uniref:Rhinocladiella mackenziei CBS 650.93 unplaced genomic scaffold supercont1.6, whole genome shotgun sequence n=1 Tax=Rhinocladiella mackenziei CBS 650.93 TaxID=1442369 RepID=A0A0D2IHA3_9EURO|nr:uncharacterized protein Z518_08628 [Rhinocladiella mackenziei CBS 650.93]KIX02686.1 hypothetical protein Z518_08628 [Rhinocladiella mackenziei CBS 650.93]
MPNIQGKYAEAISWRQGAAVKNLDLFCKGMKPPLPCGRIEVALARSVTRQLRNYSRTCQFRRYQHTSPSGHRFPRVAQSSIWHSIIPKALRSRPSTSDQPATKKPPNPATYFIWIYLLIGSQAMRIMGVKNEYTAFIRKADRKVAQLREVVEKLQRGEEVDVEKILGTGDETQEREWEEALKELEEEDRIWQSNKKKSREEQERLAREEQDATPVNDSMDKIQPISLGSVPTQPNPHPSPGFY